MIAQHGLQRLRTRGNQHRQIEPAAEIQQAVVRDGVDPALEVVAGRPLELLDAEANEGVAAAGAGEVAQWVEEKGPDHPVVSDEAGEIGEEEAQRETAEAAGGAELWEEREDRDAFEEGKKEDEDGQVAESVGHGGGGVGRVRAEAVTAGMRLFI